MPQLVLTILHQLSLDWKAHNVLNRDALRFEGCSNSVGRNEVPRLVEGNYHRTLYSLNEVQGAGCETRHLAISQSRRIEVRENVPNHFDSSRSHAVVSSDVEVHCIGATIRHSDVIIVALTSKTSSGRSGRHTHSRWVT